MSDNIVSGLFTDVGKIKLLLNSLMAASKNGILLSDAYYWLDMNGARNERIDNTLALLKDAHVIHFIDNKLFLTEEFVNTTSVHSIEKTLRIYVLSNFDDNLIDEIFKNRFLYNDGHLAIKVNSISPMYIEARNLLINIGGFLQVKDTLICSNAFEKVLIDKGYAYFFNNKARVISEEELYSQLARKSELGKLAESIAYDSELKRLQGSELKPVMTARINTAAGYDIKSFDTIDSSEFNRFIEVKYFDNGHFFISDNELSTAKQYKEKYWLYLVDTNTRVIEKINNPFKVLQSDSEWIKRTKVTEYTRNNK